LEAPPFPAKPKRLLDDSDVAEWLGVSKGWVRDHASDRRQPRLFAIKLGPAKGKGWWKFREEDVHQFIQDQLIQDQRRRWKSSGAKEAQHFLSFGILRS